MNSSRSHFQDYLFREEFLITWCLLSHARQESGRTVAGLWHDVAEAVMAWANRLAMLLLMLGSSAQPLNGAYSYFQATACMRIGAAVQREARHRGQILLGDWWSRRAQ